MITFETLTIFVLSCFVGYYVVLKVTPALHAPLMSVTNAISSVIIIVAIGAVGCDLGCACLTYWLALLAVFLTSINIVGGFMLTHRMLAMFSIKRKKKGGENAC
ncbi:NAD(P) transhydrogenase subunit beta [Alphaproteobacteria bacterium]|nr:NAD(P) transhydrogenase subunit beta [Alphaproteobacteria bacterium]